MAKGSDFATAVVKVTTAAWIWSLAQELHTPQDSKKKKRKKESMKEKQTWTSESPISLMCTDSL